jgi:hypothetical protein
MTEKMRLTADEQKVLDEVAALALKGYDARPAHLAHVLRMSRERVDDALQGLIKLGLVLNTTGRVPRSGEA